MQPEARSYRILERLGQGAFGSVYLAETVGGGLSKRVAIKVPHPDRANLPGLVGRLRDEARMLALIRHRAIVRVDDLVELDGAWSMVMEYVEGLDVGELLDDGPFPVRAALAIAEEVANALHAAWNQPGPEGGPLRLLHRDLKPSNLRITPAGEVKVLDFGVARAEFAAREADDSGAVFGTTTYLAPERYRGEDAQAGDVYALGVTLFEMLTGVLPGKSAMDADRRPPGRLCAAQWTWLGTVHPDLVVLVGAMLANDPADRPPPRDCARRLHELRSVVGGETLEDWAERVVRARLDQRRGRQDRDEKTGTLLIERPTTTAARRTPRRAPPVLLGALGLVALGAVGLAAWLALAGRGERPPGLARATTGEASSRVLSAAEEAAVRAADLAAVDVLAGEGEAAPVGSVAAAPAVGPSAEVPAPGVPEVEEPAPRGVEPVVRVGAPVGSAVAGDPAPAGAPAAVVRPTAPAGAGPAPPPVLVPEPAPATPASPEPVPIAAPIVEAPPPEPVEPEPAPPAEPAPVAASPDTPGPGQGRLRVAGDVASAVLVGPGGRAGPGVVAAGTWKVEATLPDGTAVVLDGVVVPEGGTVTVRCSQSFRGCRAATVQ